MTLREARVAFTSCIGKLIAFVDNIDGLECALDEGMDRKTARDPTSDHMLHSNHDIGLAQDVILYRDGKWLQQTEDYRQMGLYWESLHPLARWGGKFTHADGNHFSFEWEGRR